MNPTTPTNPGSAMSHGGTFMRPGAVGWGTQTSPGDPRMPETSSPGRIEQALAAAVKDPDRVADLLDELSRGRLWLPLPDDERPVTDGSAVLLPTVTYLGAEFVPAFTSAQQLAAWHRRARPAGQVPGPRSTGRMTAPARQSPGRPVRRHAAHRGPRRRTGPAAASQRSGIALNPGAEASVPIYPEGVGYLAASLVPIAVIDGAQVRVGRPPSDPVTLLAEIRSALGAIPDVSAGRPGLALGPRRGRGPGHLGHAARPGQPKPRTAEVISAIEQAVGAVPEQGFPIDVTFPGEGEPDELDEWISAHAEPFYIRG